MKYNIEEKNARRISWANFIEFYGIDLILCNEMNEHFNLEFINVPELEDGEYLEIFQYYIFKERDLNLIEKLNEPILYCAELDLYILGVTHWGTGWDYVLTPIKLTEGVEGLLYPTA